ncbi:hypothetical protein EJB05_56184 [Eragrostis curvula]|uniref:Generative cell specific-1/HAP2 domain-containing protein n=1 Tax=Eragrostis curvula TaxID=38414 RepID=A0A5J9SGY4_9POAL|nr:hypothetical protein EJB05_56184 [Eragrostis curvula]
MASPDLPAMILTLLALLCAGAGAVEILSNSHRETCVRDSDHLSCDQKIVVNAAVPSGSSGAEASVVANIAETAVDNNTGTKETKYIRDPPVDVTISKSAVYAAYDLVYLRDVAYKPVDETRKCEPDAGADVVQSLPATVSAHHLVA